MVHLSQEVYLVCKGLESRQTSASPWGSPGAPRAILTPMNADAFGAYREAAAAGYADDNVTAGRWPKDGALQRSLADFDASLPQGLATPDNFLYEIGSISTGATVGVLWFAVVVKNGLPSAFVYDVEVRPEWRRRGYARAAFTALEPLVRGLGLSSIDLHVFGNNVGAQALYRALGYGVTGINMRKQIGSGDA